MQDKKNSNIKKILVFSWTIVLFSQFLRNGYPEIYFPILLTLFILIIIFIFNNGFIFGLEDYLTISVWIFFFLIIYICSISFIFSDLKDFLKAFPRIIIMPLSFIIFLNFATDKRMFLLLTNILILFSFIASLSVIYQVYFGPLQFLVDSTMRLGLERYASTFGSLTIFGGVTGIICMLVLRNNLSFLIKILLLGLFFIASLITLSKAAILNILLVIIFSIFFVKIRNKIILTLSIIILTTIVYFSFPEINEYLNKSYEMIFENNENVSSNATVKFQIFKRIFEAPIYLSQFSIINLFFGFGLIGGQGAFGLPYSFTGTTHNQLADMFLIGGIFLFLNILSILLCLMIELKKYKDHDYLAETFYYCNVIGIINMFFFNGFLFQPITSFVFWVSLVYVFHLKKLKYEKSL